MSTLKFGTFAWKIVATHVVTYFIFGLLKQEQVIIFLSLSDKGSDC